MSFVGTFSRRLAGFLLLMLAFPGSWVQAADPPLTPVRLQLRWLHQFQFAGYYAALHKGYYRDAGLGVTIVPGSPEHQPVPEVLKGHADYGVANAELIYHYLKGEPLVALAAIYQHSPSVLLVRADSGIRNPHNLVGQSIMLMGGESDVDILAMFRREGIDLGQLDIRPSSFQIQDLADGKVDAFNAYLTNEPFYLESKGIEARVIDPSQYGVDFYSDILFTSQEEIRHHPERVKAFREASIKGWAYALAHKDEIIDLILKEYSPEKPREHLAFEADAIEKLIQPRAVAIGHMNPGRFELMAGTMVETGLVPKERSLKALLYDPEPRIDRESLLALLQIIAGLLLASLLLVLVMLGFNRRLNREIDERHKAEQHLKLLNEHHALLNDLAFELLSIQGNEFDQILERLLGSCGTQLNLDRMSIFQVDEVSQTFNCTHEWCAPGVGSAFALRQGLPMAAAAWWWQQIIRRGILQVDDIDAAPPEADFEKQHWRAEGLKSLLAAPLQFRGKIHGFIILDSLRVKREWATTEIWFLESLAQILSNTLSRLEVTENLREARDFAENLITSASIIILVLDAEGRIQSFNPYFEQLSGYHLAEMRGEPWLEHFIPETDTPRIQGLLTAAAGGSFSQGVINPIRIRDGRELLIEWRNQPLCDKDGQTTGILAIGQDVTERKRIEEQLQLAASVFTHTQEGICITNAEGIIVNVNDAYTAITGYSREEAIGQAAAMRRSGHHSEEFYQAMLDEIVTQGHWHGEAWNIRKNGELYPELLTVNQVLDKQGQVSHFVCVFTEISAIKAYEEKLKQMAHYDALTGLPNRVLVADRLNQAMAQHERRGRFLAVVFIDLDGFKQVNDSYGHEVGDRLLAALAVQMRSALREGDTIGRLGGDEFIALLIDLEQKTDAIGLLERLLRAASEPVILDAIRLLVSASIGVSFYPQNEGLDAEGLLRQADKAMYEAKQAGKNRYLIAS